MNDVLHRAAFGCLLAFVAIVLLEHVLVPELAPARHTISEYVNARPGGLMTGAFLAWSASLAMTAVLVWRDRPKPALPVASAVLMGLLVIATLGLLVTTCFRTQTSAGILPPGTQRSAGGRLHDLGSGIAMLALFGAVIASIGVIGRRGVHGRWALGLFVLAVAINTTLLTVGDDVAGVRQRLLVAVACLWQAVVLLALQERRRVSVSSSSMDATGPLRSMSR